MKKEKIYKNWDLIVILVASLMRIYLGNILGIWFLTNNPHDDGLLVNYADLETHFITQDFPKNLLMVKEMMFSFFLNVVHWTGLSYSLILSLLWIFAAVLVRRFMGYITSNKIYLLFSYIFVLFAPVAFDSLTGTRLYRNSIIAPFVLITFTLMLMLLIYLIKNANKSIKGALGIATILGMFFSFTAYIKEDGIWILACMILVTIVCLSVVVIRYKNNKRKLLAWAITICLPLMIFGTFTNIYKCINYHYYGVYATNTRTSAELGKFVKYIYKVDSDNRTDEIWTPTDAIEKIFLSSETLQKYPEVWTNIVNTPWLGGGTIYETPIQGEFITWVIRDALVEADLWKSEKQVNDMFKQVNKEVDNAFKVGKLKKDKKFQLVSSTGGRSFSEISSLWKPMYKQYLSAVFLKEYEEGGVLPTVKEEFTSDYASFLCNFNLSPLSERATQIRNQEIINANKFVSVIFKIYAFVQPLLWFCCVIGMCISIVTEIKKYIKEKSKIDFVTIIVMGMIIGLFGISLAYTFSIGWYCSYIDDRWLKFYSVGLVPMCILIELLGTYLFFSKIKRIINR